MGKYYRHGRLWSADTFTTQGTRTLAGATESHLWAGTNAARPTPGGIQLRFASTSIEDDVAKQQKQTITITGAMDQATTDKWTSTLAGGVDAGDIARLVLNGVNYDTMVTPVLNTLALLSAEVATSGNSGTWDTWQVVPGGVLDVGDQITLTIPGSAAPFVVTVGGAILTATDVADALATAVNADGICPYSAGSSAANLFLTNKIRGVGVVVTCTWTTDPGLNSTVTVTQPVVGVAGQAAWTVTTDGISAVICTHATAEATADTVTSSYVYDPLANSTFVAVHTITGANADILAVSDGTTTFSRTVLTAVLADECAALAALINADAAYIASAALGVITVEAAVAGVGFAMVNVSTDNQTADLSVVIVTTVANSASTGIRTLRLDYLDAAGVRQSETVALNGLTAVLSTASDVTAVLGLAMLTFGSGAAAAGTIECTNGADSETYEVISVGATQGLSAALTVPLAHLAYVTVLQLSAGAISTTVKLKSDVNPATGAIVSGAAYIWQSAIVGTDPAMVSPAAPIGPFPAGARIWLTGTSGAGTACQGSFEGFYEPVV